MRISAHAQRAEVSELRAEIERLKTELSKLRDDYKAAGQWCTDACCEFKKDQRVLAPDLDKLAENMAAASAIARA